MAQPKLQASFFISKEGVCLTKAPPLKYKQRLEIYQRDGSICQICKQEVILGGSDDHPFKKRPVCGAMDHVLARSRGCQNNNSNLRLLCKSCNSSKGAK